MGELTLGELSKKPTLLRQGGKSGFLCKMFVPLSQYTLRGSGLSKLVSEPAGTEPMGTEPMGTEPEGTEPAGTGSYKAAAPRASGMCCRWRSRLLSRASVAGLGKMEKVRLRSRPVPQAEGCVQGHCLSVCLLSHCAA